MQFHLNKSEAVGRSTVALERRHGTRDLVRGQWVEGMGLHRGPGDVGFLVGHVRRSLGQGSADSQAVPAVIRRAKVCGTVKTRAAPGAQPSTFTTLITICD